MVRWLWFKIKQHAFQFACVGCGRRHGRPGIWKQMAMESNELLGFVSCSSCPVFVSSSRTQDQQNTRQVQKTNTPFSLGDHWKRCLFKTCSVSDGLGIFFWGRAVFFCGLVLCFVSTRIVFSGPALVVDLGCVGEAVFWPVVAGRRNQDNLKRPQRAEQHLTDQNDPNNLNT